MSKRVADTANISGEKKSTVEISADDALDFFLDEESRRPKASTTREIKYKEIKSGVWFQNKLYACRICMKAFTFTDAEQIETHDKACYKLDTLPGSKKCSACFVPLRDEDILPHYKSAGHVSTMAKLKIKLANNPEIAFSATNDGPDFVDVSVKHLQSFKLMGTPLKARIDDAEERGKRAVTSPTKRIVEHIREAMAFSAKNAQTGSKELARYSELITALRTLRGFASLRYLPCEVGNLNEELPFGMYDLSMALKEITPAGFIDIGNKELNCVMCKKTHPFHSLVTAGNLGAFCDTLIKKIAGERMRASEYKKAPEEQKTADSEMVPVADDKTA